MNARQIIHNYMLSATMPSKSKVKIVCKDKKKGKEVYGAISEAFPTYAGYIKKTKDTATYKDFVLKFDYEWAAREFRDLLLKVKSDSSLKVEETPLQKEEPAPEPAPGPGKIDTTTTKVSGTYSGGQVSGTYSGGQASVPSDSSVQGVPLSGSNNKTMFIVAGAVVLLMLIILLLWRRK